MSDIKKIDVLRIRISNEDHRDDSNDGVDCILVARSDEAKFVLAKVRGQTILTLAGPASGLQHKQLAPDLVGDKGENLLCAGTIALRDRPYVRDFNSFSLYELFGFDHREGLDYRDLELLICKAVKNWRDRLLGRSDA